MSNIQDNSSENETSPKKSSSFESLKRVQQNNSNENAIEIRDETTTDTTSIQVEQIDAISTVSPKSRNIQINPASNSSQYEIDIANINFDRALNEKGEVEVGLTWNNLNAKNRNHRSVLVDCFGEISPGTLVAIVGHGNSGKSKLISALSGRNTRGMAITGDVRINGSKRSQSNWYSLSAYINSSFDTYDHLTVAETLEFICTAKKDNNFFRMFDYKNVMDDFKTNKRIFVDYVLHFVGLERSKGTAVGRLSDGERIRMNIGTELIGNPGILFLDEPIRDLDISNSLKILKICRNLADSGKTVVMSAENPKSQMVPYFDRIHLLARGGPVFDGTVSDAVTHFGALGFQLRPNCNPFDFLHNVTAVDQTDSGARLAGLEKIFELKRSWKKSPLQSEKSDLLGVEPGRRVLLGRKLSLRENLDIVAALIRIFLINSLRDTRYLLTRGTELLVSGGVTLLVHWDRSGGRKGAGITDFSGLFIALFVIIFYTAAATTWGTFTKEQRVVIRERWKEYYGSTTGYLCKLVAVTILSVHFVGVFMAVFYYGGIGGTKGEIASLIGVAQLGVMEVALVVLLMNMISQSTTAMFVVSLTCLASSGALFVFSSFHRYSQRVAQFVPLHMTYRALLIILIRNRSEFVIGGKVVNAGEVVSAMDLGRFSLWQCNSIVLGRMALLILISILVMMVKTRMGGNRSKLV